MATATTNLGELLVKHFEREWDLAKARTDSYMGWGDVDVALEAVELTLAGAEPPMWKLGGSPALFDALLRERIASDAMVAAISAQQGIAREKRVGQGSLGFWG